MCIHICVLVCEYVDAHKHMKRPNVRCLPLSHPTSLPELANTARKPQGSSCLQTSSSWVYREEREMGGRKGRKREREGREGILVMFYIHGIC